MGELIYAGCRFEDAEEMAEATGIPKRFIEKRILEGRNGKQIVDQWDARKEILKHLKYLGL